MKYVIVTDLVIKALEAMSDGQGTKILKIQVNNKVPLHPFYWVELLDYDDEYNDDNENYTN